MTDKKRGAPLLAQETPRRNNPRQVYHEPQKKSSGNGGKNNIFLIFVAGTVFGLVIGLITAVTISASIHKFEARAEQYTEYRMEVVK